ncbi:hypothetical protein [Sneathia sanguinegens]
MRKTIEVVVHFNENATKTMQEKDKKKHKND